MPRSDSFSRRLRCEPLEDRRLLSVAGAVDDVYFTEYSTTLTVDHASWYIAETGFNDAAGINSNTTLDTPYQLDGTIRDRGSGEAGWSNLWTLSAGGGSGGSPSRAVAETGDQLEGDACLFIKENDRYQPTWVHRNWTPAQDGPFIIEQHVRFPAGGGVSSRPGRGGTGSMIGPQWSASGGVFYAGDGDTAGSAPAENTGFTWEPMQWYKVSLVVDPTTQTYEFYVDDQKYESPDPLGFRGNISSLYFMEYLTDKAVWVDQIRIISLDESRLVGVLGNDIDAENDLLSAILVDGPSDGTLSLNSDGTFTYTPDPGFYGPDTFTYKAFDNVEYSNIATVTIHVDNHPPVAVDDEYGVDEDAWLFADAADGVLDNDFDSDDDPLTAVLTAGPEHAGWFTFNDDGSFIYSPEADYNGMDSFTYIANDGVLDSNSATVWIAVNPLNDAPVAADDGYDVDEDETLEVAALHGVLANDPDVDGDLLYATATLPSHGTLDFNEDGSFSYTPDPDFNGTDSFGYFARDGQSLSNFATVTITVNSVNDAPIAADDSYTTPHDTPLVVDNASLPETVLFDDFESGVSPGWSTTSTAVTPTGNRRFLGQFANSQVSLSLDDLPAHESVSVEFDLYLINSWDGNLSGTHGPDHWSFGITDGPMLLDTTFSNNHPVTFGSGQAYPGDWPSGSYTPLTGAVEINSLGYIFDVLNQGPRPMDSVYHMEFTFAHDSDSLSLWFEARNLYNILDESWGLDNVRITTTDTPGVLANDTDPDGDPLTAHLVSGPSNGALTLNADGTFEYVPEAGFIGIDTFTYKALDGTDDSNLATVTITVNSANNAPIAADDSYTTPRDTTLVIDDPYSQETVLFDDFESGVSPGWSTTSTAVTPTGNRGFLGQFANGQVSLSLDELPAHESVVVEFDLYVIDSWDGNSTRNSNGPDIWRLEVDGGSVLLNTTFSNAPHSQAYPDAYPDGNNPTQTGAAEVNTLGYSFFGDSVYHLEYSFEHSADSLQLNFLASGLSADINDESWGLDNVRVTTTADAIGVLANDTDADGDPLTAHLVSGPSNGALTLNADGTFEYVPQAGFIGIDTFTYKALDGTDDSNTATVTINVVNHPPAAVDDEYGVDEDMSLVVEVGDGVLHNDLDSDNDPLTAVLTVGPEHAGWFTFNDDGSFIYSPEANYNGTDSFTYIANDGVVDSNLATVTITVNPLNDAPLAVDDSYDMNKGETLEVAASQGVLANDIDVDGDLLHAGAAPPSNGTLSFNADGSFSYVPDPGFNGTDSFGYFAHDWQVFSNFATVTINVNHPPVADAGGIYSVDEGDSVTLSAAGSHDPDGSIVSYEWDLDNDGQYDDASGQTVSFHRTNDGGYLVRVKVTDDNGAYGTDTALVTVNNVSPMADAGGPYVINMGGTVILEASGSTDPGNDIVSYEWDFDADGQYDDASGPMANYVASTAGTFTVAVKVTDDDGAWGARSAQVIVLATDILLGGDANYDGTVDQADKAIVTANWQKQTGAIWAEGDFNGDGKVNGIDVTIMAANWGRTAPPATSSSAAIELEVETLAAAPEVSYDLDNDGRIGLGDLAFFASVYREKPGITTESPHAYAADYDRSGTVDLGDLAFFAANYRLARPNDSLAQPAEVSQSSPAAPQTATTAATSMVAVDDLDVTILARHWMMGVADMDDEDDARDAVFAAVGSEGDMLGLLDE